MSFKEFELDPNILGSLDAMGFTEPTPIQEKAIPIIKQGKDLIGCAQTGTGKTAAFLLPLLDRTEREESEGTQALVVVPTRELAMQIDQELQGFGYFSKTSSIAIYGGGDSNAWDIQKNALENGVEIVITTPGRFLMHMKLGHVDLSPLQTLILDEADRMLDMGFSEDIMKIAGETPESRQTLLFSATMPPQIRELANQLLKEPEEINIETAKPADNIIQGAYSVYEKQKLPLIQSLLSDKHDLSSVLIFVSTKRRADELGKTLKDTGLNAQSIHSDLSQEKRGEVLRAFRSKRIQALVATDVLQRGIDIKGIQVIINYNVPRDPEDYVHRIGRTARLDEEGVALTLINEEEQRYFQRIEKFLGKNISKLPLPPGFEPGPEYDPKKHKGSKKGRRAQRK